MIMTTDKMTKLTISLTAEEVEQLKILATKASQIDWRTFCSQEFREHVIKAPIGKPRVGTSGIEGNRISAPSTNKFYNSNHR